jgi:hypothetical protein
MKKKRKIAMVVRKISFADAEEADNIYWSNASEEERLRSAIELRNLFFGRKKTRDTKIYKVVYKRSLYEEEQGS